MSTYTAAAVLAAAMKRPVETDEDRDVLIQLAATAVNDTVRYLTETENRPGYVNGDDFNRRAIIARIDELA